VARQALDGAEAQALAHELQHAFALRAGQLVEAERAVGAERAWPLLRGSAMLAAG
jgi:hypothetical protein